MELPAMKVRREAEADPESSVMAVSEACTSTRSSDTPAASAAI
jgi:hypothetical protein